MNKGIQKDSFPTAYMMAIYTAFIEDIYIKWVSDNFAKNVHEFVVFIFVVYIHHI